MNTVLNDKANRGANQPAEKHFHADYNLAIEWTPVEATEQITMVQAAFQSWNLIREEAIAQSFLVALLKNRKT